MRHVEFLGIPGSGKSTLARRLTRPGPASQRIWSLDEGVRLALRRQANDRMTRLVAATAPSAQSRLWEAMYARAPDRAEAMIRFATNWPSYLEAVLAAQQARAGRDHRAEVVLGWILNLGARFQLAQGGLTSDDILLIDEGFAQRSVALFGHGWQPGDAPLLTRYVEAMPIPDRVVVVDTPIELCRQRLDRFGWPERSAHLADDERLTYLKAASVIVESTTGQLGDAGVPMSRVSGASSVEEGIAEIRPALSD